MQIALKRQLPAPKCHKFHQNVGSNSNMLQIPLKWQLPAPKCCKEQGIWTEQEITTKDSKRKKKMGPFRTHIYFTCGNPPFLSTPLRCARCICHQKFTLNWWGKKSEVYTWSIWDRFKIRCPDLQNTGPWFFDPRNQRTVTQKYVYTCLYILFGLDGFSR